MVGFSWALTDKQDRVIAGFGDLSVKKINLHQFLKQAKSPEQRMQTVQRPHGEKKLMNFYPFSFEGKEYYLFGTQSVDPQPFTKQEISNPPLILMISILPLSPPLSG